MSRVMRLLAVALCLASWSAHANRMVLGGQGSSAKVKAEVVAGRGEISPVRVDFELPFVDIETQADGFAQVTAPGLVPMGQAGRPALFTSGSLIAVPEGYEARLSVLERQATEAANVLVAPSQTKYRCDCPQNNSFRFDSALYQSQGLFPATDVALEEVGKLQGLRLMRVALYPLRMDFARRALSVTSRLSVLVSFAPTGSPTRKAILTPALFDLARATTVNGAALASRALARAEAEVLLIISADSLKGSLQELVAWERAKGLKVELFSLTEAGGTKESLKKFVQNYYDTHAVKPSYLILVGNGTTMPPMFESTGSGPAASDYPFSLLSGNDHVPDLLYGRIVADNEQELRTQVSRWINYERSPVKGADWYAKALTIASDEGWDPSDKEYAERIKQSLTSHTYTTVDSLLQGESTATEANITKGLSEGRTWLAYFGHGSGTSWGSTNEEFDVEAVDRLTNKGGRLPVIIDVACSNASYVKIPRSFGKAWVTHESDGEGSGAVAFYGGSVIISWHPPAIMSEGIAKYHFEKPVRTLGGSVLAGQLYLIEKQGVTEDTLDNLRWYNLFGDPSLLMRTATPKSYTVLTRVDRNEREITLNVSAVDLSGKPMPELRVSLSSDGYAPHAVAVTDTTGKAVITLPASVPAGSVMTVTGYNAETQTRVVF